MVELLCGLAADAPQPSDDDVPAKSVDATLHLAPTSGIAQPHSLQVFHGDAKRVKEAPDPGQREHHGEDASPLVEGLALAVTDRGDRGHGHEEGVDPGPAQS